MEKARRGLIFGGAVALSTNAFSSGIFGAGVPLSNRSTGAGDFMTPVSFTYDLENHLETDVQARYDKPTRRFMDFWERHQIKGTVFVVGEIARRSKDLIREIADAGHEIGYHSHSHLPLEEETPKRLRAETASDKAFIEDLTGRPVVGYRAPSLSLTRRSVWTTDVFQDLGFLYSSSVLPARSPIYGFPGAPPEPFKWPCGLIELPAPVFPARVWRVPYMGGIYFRYAPALVIRLAHRMQSRKNTLPWCYLHAHDVDSEEPFARVRNAGLMTSFLMWMNRGGTFGKIDKLFGAGGALPLAGPLAERIKAETTPDRLPVFDPDTNTLQAAS